MSNWLIIGPALWSTTTGFTLERELAQLAPCREILELAGGTGIWTKRLAAIGQKVTEMDASPGRFRFAREHNGGVLLVRGGDTIMNILDVPYNQHLTLDIERCDDQEILCLKAEKRHLNHLGTIHAGAIFSLAEAASAHTLLLTFPQLSEKASAVLREAGVKYRRPATGKIRAFGEVDSQEAAAFGERLESKGRGTIQVAVKVLQGEDEVFVGTYTWFASGPR